MTLSEGALKQWLLETNRRLTALEVDGEAQADLVLALERQRVVDEILLAAVAQMDRKLEWILVRLEHRD